MTRPYRWVSTAEQAEMERLYLSGLTLAEVGAELGRSSGTVRWVLLRNGVEMRTGGSETKAPVRPAPWHPDIPAAEECRARADRLSPRQREVLDLIAHGFTTKEAVSRMGITLKTFHNTLGMAMDVLGVRPPRLAVALLARAATEATPTAVLEGVRLAS